MKEVLEYLKTLYLKAGVKFFIEEVDTKLEYTEDTENIVISSVLSLIETDYTFFLKVLSTLIAFNYNGIKDFYDELTAGDDEETIAPPFEDEESNNAEDEDPEAQIIIDDLIEDLDKILSYIEDASCIEELYKKLQESGDLVMFIGTLLDFNANLVFENTYEQICSNLVADSDKLKEYQKFISNNDLSKIFMIGFAYLLNKRPNELLYTLESFFLCTNDMAMAYESHAQIVQSLLRKGLYDHLTTYIAEILWETYTSYKGQEYNDNVSAEAREYVENYEMDAAFRERECQNLIFNPQQSTVLRLYLEFNDLEPYPSEDLKDAEVLFQKRKDETTKFIRKLILEHNN